MAAILSQVGTFLFSPSCPQALRDWILLDLGRKAEDVREIEASFQELEGRYQKYGVLVDVSVHVNISGAYEVKKQQFLQYPSGKWYKFKGWIYGGESVFPVTDWQISYASSYETVVEKQELTDSDAFDLMDSIREEIKYGNNS